MLTFNAEDKSLIIKAKDTGDIAVRPKNYLLDEGDTVYFTVNDGIEKENPKIQKVITEFTNHMAVIRLNSNDTNLPIGIYFYDIQVNTADGRVDTVLGPRKFKIKGGVTY